MTGAINSLLCVLAINCMTSHSLSQKNDEKWGKFRAGHLSFGAVSLWQMSSGKLVRGNWPVTIFSPRSPQPGPSSPDLAPRSSQAGPSRRRWPSPDLVPRSPQTGRRSSSPRSSQPGPLRERPPTTEPSTPKTRSSRIRVYRRPSSFIDGPLPPSFQANVTLMVPGTATIRHSAIVAGEFCGQCQEKCLCAKCDSLKIIENRVPET